MCVYCVCVSDRLPAGDICVYCVCVSDGLPAGDICICNNNNNDFISIALFHVRHAQLL